MTTKYFKIVKKKFIKFKILIKINNISIFFSFLVMYLAVILLFLINKIYKY